MHAVANRLTKLPTPGRYVRMLRSRKRHMRTGTLVRARRWLTTEALGRCLLNSMLDRPPDPVATKTSSVDRRPSPASVPMNRKSGAFLFYADASVTLPRKKQKWMNEIDHSANGAPWSRLPTLDFAFSTSNKIVRLVPNSTYADFTLYFLCAYAQQAWYTKQVKDASTALRVELKVAIRANLPRDV